MSLTGRAYTRQLRDGRPVGVHHVDLGVAVAVARERDLGPIRGPGRTEVSGRSVGEPHRVRAVGLHHVDLGVPIAVALEGDLRPVGRPGGLHICSRVQGKAGAAGAIGVDHVDLGVAVSGAHERKLRDRGARDVELGESGAP